MKTKTLLEKATNPHLYDKPEIMWVKFESDLESGKSRHKFFKVFKNNSEKWKGSRVLEIGCGTGWLANEIAKVSGKSVIGIDPSVKNIKFGRLNFKNINLQNVTLDEFEGGKFDLIVCNMVFEHIANVQKSFDKIASMLPIGKEFHLVIGNYEYMKTPRKNYNLTLEQIDNESYVVETNRIEGLLSDIVRKPEVILRCAENAGLQLQKIENIANKSKLPVAFFFKFKKITESSQDRYVACIGKSTISKNKIYYNKIKQVGELLIRKGFGVVHGGYSGGSMGAISEGAEKIIKRLEKRKNLNKGVPLANFDVLFSRNNNGYFIDSQVSLGNRIGQIIDNSVAVIALPEGGLGTLTELIYSFHLNQINKIFGKSIKPIILFGGKWRKIFDNISANLGLEKDSLNDSFIYEVNNLSELEDTLDLIT